jgi:hypothetical protein
MGLHSYPLDAITNPSKPLTMPHLPTCKRKAAPLDEPCEWCGAEAEHKTLLRPKKVWWWVFALLLCVLFGIVLLFTGK